MKGYFGPLSINLFSTLFIFENEDFVLIDQMKNDYNLNDTYIYLLDLNAPVSSQLSMFM